MRTSYPRVRVKVDKAKRIAELEAEVARLSARLAAVEAREPYHGPFKPPLPDRPSWWPPTPVMCGGAAR